MAVAAGVVRDSEGVEASLRDMLAAALEANREMARLAAELREENARLRAENAQQATELESLRADLAVFQRMLFGRSSERSGSVSDSGDGDGGCGEQRRGDAGGSGRKRGPGARAGRRDYSHLPWVEVIWDFDGGGYCCPECGEPFTLLGEHVPRAAGLGGDRAGGGALPPPVPQGLPVPGAGHGDGARPG